MTIATDQGDWVKQHLGTIEQSYGKAPHAGEVLPAHYVVDGLRGAGGVRRVFTHRPSCALCVRAGATTYLSGPAAQAYMGVEAFANRGVNVEWMSYEGYQEYPQLHGGTLAARH